MAFLIVGLVLIVVFFNIDGFIPTGKGLAKSDWLVFTGGYLALCASVVIAQLVYFRQKGDAIKEKIRLKNENMPSFMSEHINNYVNSIDPEKHESYLMSIKKFYGQEWKRTATILLKADEVFIITGGNIEYGEIFSIYKIANEGEGTARDIYFEIEGRTAILNRHIKVDGYFYLVITADKAFLEKSRKKELNIKYTDIYGNVYGQKFEITNNIVGGQYSFDISNFDLMPENF